MLIERDRRAQLRLIFDLKCRADFERAQAKRLVQIAAVEIHATIPGHDMQQLFQHLLLAIHDDDAGVVIFEIFQDHLLQALSLAVPRTRNDDLVLRAQRIWD